MFQSKEYDGAWNTTGVKLILWTYDKVTNEHLIK